MKESGFLANCARCSGFGHEESTCSSDAAVLAIELPMSEEDLAVEAYPFLAKETGHTYACDKDGETLNLKGEKTIHFPLIRKLCRQYGCRPEAKGRVVDTACVVISSVQAKAPTTPTDINTSYCTYGHTHEVLLKKMVEQQGVDLSGELHECRGCSGTFFLSHAPAATVLHCRRGGVCSGGGRERGGGVKSCCREDVRLGQRVQPRQHDGGVAPVSLATREAPAADFGAGTVGVWKATP